VSWVVTPRTYDDPDVVRMVAEVQAEYVQMYGSPDEAAVDPGEFVPPAGLIMVGALGGDAVATGGWRRRAPGQAEIKRMYVAARARRQGLARLMLAEVERTAAAAGVTRLVLNTGSLQVPAIALYRAAGYADSEAFGHYAEIDGAVFLAKELPERT
jgi:ribosomal protein S18 acetylase RimI-like enzyme